METNTLRKTKYSDSLKAHQFSEVIWKEKNKKRNLLHRQNCIKKRERIKKAAHTTYIMHTLLMYH